MKLSPNQQRVLNVIRDGRLATIDEIAEAAGIHPNYCGNIMAILRQRQLIEKVWVVRPDPFDKVTALRRKQLEEVMNRRSRE